MEQRPLKRSALMSRKLVRYAVVLHSLAWTGVSADHILAVPSARLCWPLPLRKSGCSRTSTAAPCGLLGSANARSRPASGSTSLPARLLSLCRLMKHALAFERWCKDDGSGGRLQNAPTAVRRSEVFSLTKVRSRTCCEAQKIATTMALHSREVDDARFSDSVRDRSFDAGAGGGPGSIFGQAWR